MRLALLVPLVEQVRSTTNRIYGIVQGKGFIVYVKLGVSEIDQHPNVITKGHSSHSHGHSSSVLILHLREPY